MNYFTLIEDIKRTSLQFAEEFYEGDVYEFLNSGNHKYPSIILTTQNVSTTDNINSISGTLFCVDRLTDDSSNRLEIQSSAFNKLQRIISALEENTINLQSNTYTPFTEKFADLCGGMFVEFSFQYVGESLCDDLEIKEIELTQNGIYDVIGYDRAIVNVRPVVNLEDITITDNGEYTCGEGFDGFGKVNVDLNAKLKFASIANSVNNSCINTDGEWEYGKLIDWSNLTNVTGAWSSASNLKKFNYPFMDTSNITSFELCFRRCSSLRWLDIRGWDFGKANTSKIHLFHDNIPIRTLIGDCTLEDVENNGVTVFDNAKNSAGTFYCSYVRYSSLLAGAYGVADLSETITQVFQLSKNAWNSMYNDDDTKPSAEIIAQRQNKLTEILTNKNWTITLL